MSYTPSFMHIISAERRVANECSPDLIQTVSENGYTHDRVNWDIPMKNPIQAYSIKTLSFIQEYVYSREMKMDNSIAIRQRAMRGSIQGEILYVRKYPFESFNIHAKKEFVNEILKARAVSRKRAVSAENSKTGEIIHAESLTAMAVLLNTVTSSVSMYLLRKVRYQSWGIWYSELEKPEFRNKIEKKDQVRPERAKPCAVISIESKIRKDYPSVQQAAKVLGLNASTLRHSIEMGYTVKKLYEAFYIVNGELVNPKQLKPEQRRQRNSVIAIDNVTGERKEFESARIAADALKCDRTSLCNCARSGYNCKGHKVFLVCNGEIVKPKDKGYHQNGKAVIAYNDKEELSFHSQTACAKALKATSANVNRAIDNGHTVKGYKIRSA